MCILAIVRCKGSIFTLMNYRETGAKLQLDHCATFIYLYLASVHASVCIAAHRTSAKKTTYWLCQSVDLTIMQLLVLYVAQVIVAFIVVVCVVV